MEECGGEKEVHAFVSFIFLALESGGKRANWYRCHMFYEQRVVEIPDGLRTS